MSHTTGDIDAHELAIDGKDEIIFVNTKYSCLATLDVVHSFKPVWKPPFISNLAPEDRCHLNGHVKARDGEPRCGAFIIDTRNGDILHWIKFDGAVREMFDASFIPGVRAPMCVGLGNPEMRTLITFAGEPSGSKAEAVVQ
jgi:hypothetical protein